MEMASGNSDSRPKLGILLEKEISLQEEMKEGR
jgi:hypothetical protein